MPQNDFSFRRKRCLADRQFPGDFKRRKAVRIDTHKQKIALLDAAYPRNVRDITFLIIHCLIWQKYNFRRVYFAFQTRMGFMRYRLKVPLTLVASDATGRRFSSSLPSTGWFVPGRALLSCKRISPLWPACCRRCSASDHSENIKVDIIRLYSMYVCVLDLLAFL